MNIAPNQKTKILNTFQKQQEYAKSIMHSTANERIKKLEKIEDYLSKKSNIDGLLEALKQDLNKPSTEAFTSEITVVIGCIKNIKRNLKRWMSDERISSPLMFLGTQSYVHHEPKGCALIISPWNYPFQLAINPLLYAIAAGCTAILKPSEFSIATSQYIEDMLHGLFDEKEVSVYQGEKETSQQLLGLPFNHMYFTGSPAVGKIVMEAAAKHLSSVTLELGGKSPCIVDETVNIKSTADKLVWGKLYNNGQTCIAPDHLYVHHTISKRFIDQVIQSLEKMYLPQEDSYAKSRDYGRIISSKHFDRAVDLLKDALDKGGELVYGGDHDKEALYFSPTLIRGVHSEMKIMQEEIFCPILPIIEYTHEQEVIDDIRSRPKPLAMYINSKRNSFCESIIHHTSAGSTVINDFLIQFANNNLPFGGVNNSGIGKSHSIDGFYAFSNRRSVMKQKLNITKVLHPPYNTRTERLSKFITRWLT